MGRTEQESENFVNDKSLFNIFFWLRAAVVVLIESSLL